jgi:septal ring factor EnvC (AmiA/AmiB activator)
METGSEVMNKTRVGRLDLGAAVLALLLLALPFVSLADAQKTKKKKARKATTASTTQITPNNPTTDPIIVSRASDYQNQDVPAALPDSGTDSAAVETARDRQLAELSARIKQLESEMKNGYDEKQKRLLLNLDILTKAEQRAESLRKQRFELVEKENQIQSRLDQIEVEIRPDTIERAVAIAGSLRPEELREAKRKSLDAERRNLQSLLTQVQSTRSALDQTVEKADQLVEKLRSRLEADIDKTLDDVKDKDQ